MSFTQNRKWQEIDVAAYHDELPGITAKVNIGDYDLYIKTGWYWMRGDSGKSKREVRLVHIDATLSRGRGGNDLPLSPKQNSAEATRYDLARSWLEDACHMASTMLQMGEYTVEDLVSEWAGRRGYPAGYCKAFPEEVNQVSPLHLIANVLRQRHDRWKAYAEAVLEERDEDKCSDSLTNEEENGKEE
jgi:hypothetical protein